MLLNYATPIDCKSDVVWQHKREEAEASASPLSSATQHPISYSCARFVINDNICVYVTYDGVSPKLHNFIVILEYKNNTCN
jgi:hypothetical protein